MAKQPKITGSVLERLQANSRIKETAILTESKLYEDHDVIKTSIPIMNIAFSGEVDGGFTAGETMFAGPSKHFKTLFVLLLASFYMKKYPDAVLLFYTSEFGSPVGYFDALGIDKNRVVLTPVLDIEELKFDLMNQVKNLVKGDHCIILVDSIGNLASIKEVADAEDGESVTDMTRAKALKSFFRVLAPRCAMKELPLLLVNHVYQEQKQYGKTIVSGGTGSYYNADNIFIIGRQQDVEGTGADRVVNGYVFVINVEKSRYVKEKSKFLLEVSFAGGINKWSGLLAIARDSGHVILAGKGKYQQVFENTGQIFTEEETNTAEFWTPILNDQTFKDYVKETYKLPSSQLITGEE